MLDELLAQRLTALATAEDLAALGLDLLDRVQVHLDRAGVDERAHQGASVERVADPDLLVGRDELLGEAVGDALVEEQAAGAGAALSGRAYGTKQNGASC